tara:strand:+ start:549 stop:1094 length:546 start_codon:yes stop_codon:yes gene_type:complete
MTTTNIEQKKLRVYVGTYEKYNSGSIGGQWLNIKDYKSVDDFYKACKELHSNEYDPEFMFQDWEYIPNAFIGESHIDSKLFELIHHSDMKNVEFGTFVDYLDAMDINVTIFDSNEIIEQFNDRSRGNWDSFREFAYENRFNDKTCSNNCHCETYFDWDSYEHQLRYDYTYTDKRNVFYNEG